MKRIFLLFILLALASLACQFQAVDPAPASVSKEIHAYTSTHEKTMTICLTAETVYFRTGAGTDFETVKDKAYLLAGDKVTVTDKPTINPDMGAWMPVQFGGLAGFVNARYLCSEVR